MWKVLWWALQNLNKICKLAHLHNAVLHIFIEIDRSLSIRPDIVILFYAYAYYLLQISIMMIDRPRWLTSKAKQQHSFMIAKRFHGNRLKNKAKNTLSFVKYSMSMIQIQLRCHKKGVQNVFIKSYYNIRICSFAYCWFAYICWNSKILVIVRLDIVFFSYQIYFPLPNIKYNDRPIWILSSN